MKIHGKGPGIFKAIYEIFAENTFAFSLYILIKKTKLKTKQTFVKKKPNIDTFLN